MKSLMPLKLASKYYGPYQVIERIGEVAYKLLLPIEAKILNVFYVSQFKKYHGPLPLSILRFQLFGTWEDLICQPEKVIRRRICKRNNRAVSQIHVQWKEEDASEATWEAYHPFLQKYPDFIFEDEVVTQRGELLWVCTWKRERERQR